MAVPRPLLLVLLGTFLLGATFLATRNSQTASEQVAKPAVQAQSPAAAPKPAKPGLLDGQEAVRAITSPGSPIKGASFSMRATTQELGGSKELGLVSAAGSFQRDAAGQPSFDVVMRSVDDAKREHDHVVSAAGANYLVKGGSGYRLAPSVSKTTSDLRKALTGSGDQAAVKLPAVDPGPWVKHLKTEAGGKVGGVETTHVSGSLDAKRVSADIKKLVASVGKTAEQPVKLPRGFSKKLDRAFKSTKLDAYVGTQDKIVRRVRLSVTGVVPAELRERGETARWRSVVSLSMSKVNQPQAIAAPKRLSKGDLSRAEAKDAAATVATSSLAVDPPTGLAQMGVGYLRLTAVARSSRTPRKVTAAIKAHKRVVLFFEQNGADDRATADGVAALRKRTKAFVVSDSVNNLASYGEVVQSVGVTRAPSIVIIGRDGRARLIAGYIDSEALAQEVADTR